jgi:uncharacterized membrane protein YkvA (DUF1232 family)
VTTASQTNTYDIFIQMIKKWLADLGINSKLFIEINADDVLPMTARTLASGVLSYLQLPTDLIPDKWRFIGLIDDVIVMIAGLVMIVPFMPEDRLSYYGKKFEAVRGIGEFEQVMKSTLGILWERLIQFVETLQKRTFKGKTTEEIVQSPELREELFDETMIFIANLNLDPNTLDSDIKQLPSPEKVIRLLGSGLEEAQKQQVKDEKSASQTKSAFKRMLLSATGKQE